MCLFSGVRRPLIKRGMRWHSPPPFLSLVFLHLPGRALWSCWMSCWRWFSNLLKEKGGMRWHSPLCCSPLWFFLLNLLDVWLDICPKLLQKRKGGGNAVAFPLPPWNAGTFPLPPPIFPSDFPFPPPPRLRNRGVPRPPAVYHWAAGVCNPAGVWRDEHG